MASLSDDRVSHLAHVVLDAARLGATVRDERRALQETKRTLSEVFQLEDRLDETVRKRIPRRVVPGSAEWEILYRRYMEEEIRKSRG